MRGHLLVFKAFSEAVSVLFMWWLDLEYPCVGKMSILQVQAVAVICLGSKLLAGAGLECSVP